MRLLGAVGRWLLVGIPVLRRIPVVRDLPFVRGYFRVRRIDIPSRHRARLNRAVNRETVAFLAPNHPEFATDWLIDKELSTIVAPRMASWADRGIVSLAPRFWSLNNLIANDGGGDAKEYSIEWALAGEGVLLHPEGTVRWTNDFVHRLYPGVARMAIEAARRTARPVYIVPIVWKYQFVGDVSDGLRREMTAIERALGLTAMDWLSVAQRFRALQYDILAMRAVHFGFRAPLDADFFERQEAFRRFLLARVEQHREVAGALDEAKRLEEMPRALYGGDTLTQEQIYECLKRTRDRLLRGGWRNRLATMLPRPAGPRIVHVGVPEPISVLPCDPSRSEEYELELLDRTRHAMQATLDAINQRIAPDVDRYRHPNALITSLNY